MTHKKITLIPETAHAGTAAVWRANSTSDAGLDDVLAALAAARDEIDAVLHSRGGLLISGLLQVVTAEDFERAIRRITPRLRDYVGGTSPRATVHGKIMEATNVPPTWSIPLHQEMAYTRNPPARITFFCEQPAAVGGHSLVGDMRAVLDKIDPNVRRRLDRHGLQLRRVLPSEDTLHLKPGVQKCWAEVFGTNDRRTVDSIVIERQWRSEWRADNTLELWQDLVPAIRPHPITGDSIWCNQAHFFPPACMIAWAQQDSRAADYDAISRARASNPEMLDNMFLGTGEPVSDEDALHLYEVIRSVEQPVRMSKSDVLMLDNLILAHGRRSFDGCRRILVALADHAPEPKEA